MSIDWQSCSGPTSPCVPKLNWMYTQTGAADCRRHG